MSKIAGLLLIVISLNGCIALGPILTAGAGLRGNELSESDLKKIENVRMPKDNYKKADKKIILEYMQKRYHEKYPKEEIKRIVIMSSNWSNVRKNFIHYKQLKAAVCVKQEGMNAGTIFHVYFRKDAKFENADLFFYTSRHKGHILFKNINL